MPDALIASLAEGIAVCDRELRLTAWNRRLEELTGIPAARVVGRPLSEALPALAARGTGALIDRVLRGATLRLPDLPFHHGGRAGWLSARCAPFRNATGQVMGAAAVVHEITGRRRAERGLLRSEAQLRAIFEGAAVGIALVDGEGRVVAANPALETMLGYAPGALAGRRAAELVHPGDPPGDPWAFTDGECARHPCERRLLRRDGGVLRGRITALPVPGPAGAPWLGVGMVEDVTVLRGTEEENDRLAALLRESPTPTLACDAEGRIVFRNGEAERLAERFGPGGEARLLPAEHARLVRTALESARSLRAVEVPVEEQLFSWTYHPHPRLGAVHLFAQDVTERRAAEAQLRHGALHDALTGLPNRLLFMERLARAVVAARRDPERRFAVLFLDLDRFKVVNDGLGHVTGDQMLAAVAARIRGCLREGDTAARFGGDEFAVLLDPIGDAADAVRAAQRIQAAVAAPVELDGYELFTSASVGIALSASGHGLPENLLRNADVAMYRAKAGGTGRHAVFDHAMHAAALVRLQTETDLRRALERGEFRLAWQPVVEAAGPRIAGVEALLRWSHPERGTVGPGDFVPLAEETGLIHPLGRWALREACRQVREWRDSVPAAAALEVSVNVSPRQFAQPGLAEQVRDVLEETGLPAAALRLEVTESAMLDDAEAALATLGRLKALGLRIHLDDFGTGYSSLALLHRHPIDALKVDRSFVSRVGRDPGALQLVRTVAALARGLGMGVVAEGVETPEQLAELRELGVELVQGFFFAAPLGARGMRTLLREGLRG